MPSRRLAVFREPKFLALRDILNGTDACFANLESMVVRYGEGTPAIRTGTHMVTEPELLDDLKWLGFNLLSCANSHSLNFGEEGLLLQNRYLTPRESLMRGQEKTYVRRAARPTSIRPTAASRSLLQPLIYPHHRTVPETSEVTFVASRE